MAENEKLLLSIINIGRLVKKEICHSQCLSGFSYAEIEVLNFVKKNKKTTMKALADYLYIEPPSLTPVIDSLVKKANIKRFQNKRDRREIYVAITGNGEKILQKKQEEIKKTIKRIFSSLNNKDRQDLIEIFEKISKNHEKFK